MAIDGGTALLLSEGLLDSYPPDRLDQMLFYRLGKRRHRITMRNDYESIVFDLIMAADSEGWLGRLVIAARQSRPAEKRFFEVAQRLRLAADTGGLESILDARAPDIRPAEFRAALAAAEGQVCRVERRTGTGVQALGTGFLVGPDLCMTSYHVVKRLFTGEMPAEDVRLRFDYAYGEERRPGSVFPLAADWTAGFSPNSAFEELDRESDALPAADELDYAVLRVAGEPGARPIGDEPEQGSEPRGWIERIASAPPRGGDDLVMLQHMLGEPVRLAFGEVLAVNANDTRLRHSVGTDEGSSGSPCFTLAMELTAVHQAGDPDRSSWHVPTYNRAVPAAAIFSTFAPR